MQEAIEPHSLESTRLSPSEVSENNAPHPRSEYATIVDLLNSFGHRRFVHNLNYLAWTLVSGAGFLIQLNDKSIIS